MSRQNANGIPTFFPVGTESVEEIPQRFLVDGILTLTHDGRWLFKKELIEHEGVRRFLLQQLRRTEEGEYWVVNGPQRVFVELEDSPYLILQVTLDDDKRCLHARLNDGSQETLSPETLFLGEDLILYARVKVGEAGARPNESHTARFDRNTLSYLMPFLVEVEDGGFGLELGGEVLHLPVAPDSAN